MPIASHRFATLTSSLLADQTAYSAHDTAILQYARPHTSALAPCCSPIAHPYITDRIVPFPALRSVAPPRNKYQVPGALALWSLGVRVALPCWAGPLRRRFRPGSRGFSAAGRGGSRGSWVGRAAPFSSTPAAGRRSPADNREAAAGTPEGTERTAVRSGRNRSDSMIHSLSEFNPLGLSRIPCVI